MSTTSESDDATDSATKKTVQITAYGKKGLSKRQFADSMCSKDMTERHTVENRTVKLEYDGDRRVRSVNIRDDSFRAELIAADIESEKLRVVDETTTADEYKHSLGKATTVVAEKFAEDLPDKLPGGLTRRDFWDTRWANDQDESIVRIKGCRIGERKLLKHRSERSSEDRFESDKELVAAEFRVELGPATEAEVSKLSKEVVKPFIRMLNKEEWSDRVRVSDCKEKVERKGDCFEI